MTIYVSNPSTQDYDFYYRTAITKDNSGPRVAKIPAGGQIPLGERWTHEETKYVIEQIRRNGGASAGEIRGRVEKFTDLLYREELCVTEDEIVLANKSVVQDAEERSVAQATRSALAFDRTANARGKGQRLTKITEVEVVQELARDQRPTGNESSFKLSVDPEGRTDVRLPV